MKKFTTFLLLAGLVAAFSSCAKKEDPAPEPVKQPVVRKKAPPTPVVEANPTHPFRTPSDDMKLPTDAQMAEGKDSSIGTGSQPVSNPDHAPSVAVTPPSAAVTPDTPSTPKKPIKKEDQLDPGE